MMRFMIRSDKEVTVAFEPTAEEYTLSPGTTIWVEWVGGGEDGMVAFENGMFVVWAPGGGYTRAWNADGTEIYTGPQSGP